MDHNTCPQCGSALSSDAPQGVCPKCFMGLGLAPNRHGETEAHDGRFVPPKPQQLAEHFPQLEILDLIGQGGMGAVYKARQRGLDRLVALKILPPGISEDPAFAHRFEREARALARLNHPNIVGVHDSGQSGGLFFFIMEYVDGVDLREAIATGRLQPKEALAIVPQMCDALQYAHDEAIVHRDIKPENVLVDAKGRVKIADFGLARLLGQEVDSYTLTGTHQVMGTPRYMAPEQMEGSHQVDHRADIYSLGVVFYEMLTGELPLGRFQPPSSKVQVDVRLDDVVLRILEKEPARRYQHASEIRSAVDVIRDLDRLPTYAQRLYGYEYRSKIEFCGIPLVHIATGIDPRTGKRRVAKGIIASGDIAIGLIAFGGLGIGGIVFAGCAFGIFTVAGASFGLVAAIGGVAIGLGISAGGLAVGSVAVGGLAVGVAAIGGEALGIIAHGERQPDWEMQRFFQRVILPGLILVWTVIGLTGLIAGVGASIVRMLESPSRPRERRAHRVYRTSPLAAVLLFLLLGPCIVGLLLMGAYVSFRKVDVGAEAAVANLSVSLDESTPSTWTYNHEGVQLDEGVMERLGLDNEQSTAFAQLLSETHSSYRELESRHSTRRTDSDGHQITILTIPAAEIALLQSEFWIQVGEILDDQSESRVRQHLTGLLRQESKTGSPIDAEASLLGWPHEEMRVELWKEEDRFYWNVRVEDATSQASAAGLPGQFLRFWRE